MLKTNLVSDASGMQYDLAPDGKRFVLNQAHVGQSLSSRYNVVLNWFEDVRARAEKALMALTPGHASRPL